MTFEFKLMIVEDDEVETNGWKSLLEIENAKNDEIIFNAQYAKSLLEAQELIDNSDFNAAVVDLRLEQNKSAIPNSDGNEVIKKLLDTELAVIAAFTAEPDSITIPAWAKPTVRITRKGGAENEGKNEVLNFLIENITMLKTIESSQKKIKSEMAKLFSRSIWPRWQNWITSGDEYQLALERHIASHIHASLLESQDQRVHPEEWYFIPPIREGIRTGDLISFENEYWAVITPRCDLALDKTDFIHLAFCRNVSADWEKCLNELNEAKNNLRSNTDQNKRTKLEEIVGRKEQSLRKFTQHRDNKASVHFLPELKLEGNVKIGPFCVEFPNIKSIPKLDTETLNQLTRIGSLTSEFLPSLVERFGSYFSRIGTPDYSHPEQ